MSNAAWHDCPARTRACGVKPQPCPAQCPRLTDPQSDTFRPIGDIAAEIAARATK